MNRALLTSAILLVSVAASAQQDPVFVQDDGTVVQDEYQDGQYQDGQYQDEQYDEQQYDGQQGQPSCCPARSSPIRALSYGSSVCLGRDGP